MTQLSDNQNKVIQSMTDQELTIEQISELTGIPKASLSSVLSSLVKKELLVKSDAGTYAMPSSVEEPTEIQNSKTQINLVIPYLKSEAAGEELKYALRSWEQNFKEPIRVIIVGDSEDWFSPEIIHIPHEPHLIKEVCGCPNPALIRNPQADVAHKILTALTVEELTGLFLVSNDDIFLLGETSLADITVLKAFAHDLEKSGANKGLYAQNNRLAAKVLRYHDLPVVRYGTHTPMAFESERLLEVIEKYNATEHGHPLASLYYNEVFPNARPILIDGGANDPILASAYRSDIEPSVLSKVFKTRKFLNCNAKGWIAIERLVKETFSIPSSFEK